MKSKKYYFFTIFALITTVLIGGSYFSQVEAHSNTSKEHSNKFEENDLFIGGPLVTKNRSKKIICIEDVSTTQSKNASSDKIVNKVEAQIEKLSKNNKRYREVNYHSVEVEVIEGCSFTPFLNDLNNSHPVYGGASEDRVVDLPSEESLGIFIVDQEIIDKQFKNAPNRWSPEEMLCEGLECFEVTKGIYFTSDEINDSKMEPILYQELIYGFGLETMISIDEEKQKKDRERKEQEKKELKKKKENEENETNISD
ncbi:hypothetical protein [Brevibacillus sp. AY1]|uniref:hypothetical protein n=1 Tax=Brevibacillus sp. AY1 TaxID=2807621 RepID=UPI002457D18B|nr:hypothetical protein [Brevibacillus sp. AY1]MDH4615594.1 hypothetical protein [Brevibacillus sp. AY1]